MDSGPAGPLSTICPEFQHPAASPIVAGDSIDATPAPAAAPISAIPIPSDRDRAAPIRTPILRLPSTSDDTPTARTIFDALDDVVELLFTDSVGQFSHFDWEGQHQVEPIFHAAVRYTTIGRPPYLRDPTKLLCLGLKQIILVN